MDKAAPTVIVSLDSQLAQRWPATLTVSDAEALLVKAIFAGEVAACARALLQLPVGLLDTAARSRAQAAEDVCNVIDAETNAEQDRVIALLSAAGVDAHPARTTSSTKQFHSFNLRVSPDNLEAALAVADKEGYRRRAPSHGAGWESYRRTHSAVTLIRTDEVTTRWVLRWSEATPSGWMRKVLHPSVVDYRLVDLPTPLWPLYHVLRPMRLIFDRLVRLRRHSDWIFLGTPLSLVPSLLEFAQVTPADRVVDLGCGDARILVHAAQQIGCTAYGIEQDPEYVGIARKRVEEANLNDRVRIEEGDATDARLDDASVVFLFLPQDAIRCIVPKLLQRLPSGARILAHEQVPLHESLVPDATIPVFADNSLTVTHRWIVP
jgi:hypothetical protein